jgi:Na+/proline symporter
MEACERLYEGGLVSDIGILNDPVNILEIILLLRSPDFLLGAILGALLWPGRRVAGALLGAVIGFAVCLIGWLIFEEVI